MRIDLRLVGVLFDAAGVTTLLGGIFVALFSYAYLEANPVHELRDKQALYYGIVMIVVSIPLLMGGEKILSFRKRTGTTYWPKT